MTFEKYGSYGFICDDNLEPHPLILYDFGLERREHDTYYYDNENRPNYGGYVFQYTISGCGFFETETETLKMEAGSAFLIPVPHRSKYYFSSDNGKHWTFFYLHFNGSIAQQIVNQVHTCTGPILHFDPKAPFLQMFFREYMDISNGKKYERYEASTFLYKFLMNMLRETESNGQSQSSAIEQGHEWIQRHFTELFSLSELCEELGISTAHFGRQFQARYGVTPSAFIHRLRLEYALSLLLNSNLNMQEIAAKSGYSDGNYFSKVFRKYVGMSPSDYRDSHGIN